MKFFSESYVSQYDLPIIRKSLLDMSLQLANEYILQVYRYDCCFRFNQTLIKLSVFVAGTILDLRNLSWTSCEAIS